MARRRVRLEVPIACEETVVPHILVVYEVQRQSTKSALPHTEPDSEHSYSFNDTEGSNTLISVRNRAILITELFRSGPEQYVSKIV